jgi:leucyl/phenylalanyl-tRNA--protein transferase
MPVICYTDSQFYFPPLAEADEEGLLVIGGSVTPSRVLEAYSKGIFPWYNTDEVPLWWSPDPRFVLFPAELHVSRSMQKVIAKNVFDFRMNTAFEEVIIACASVPRQGQNGTWITPEMKQVYIDLHKAGYAHSAEAWYGNELAGGVYGIQLGKVFFGESMFSKKANASKFAFIRFVQNLKQQGTMLVDCQVYTPHVETMGARLIDRDSFAGLVAKLCLEI